MRLFHWLFGDDIPPAYDLRQCGWRLAGRHARAMRGARYPLLVDCSRLNPAHWARLLSSRSGTASRAHVLLLGVDDGDDRARLISLGVGDVLAANPPLAEVEARAERIALAGDNLPRFRSHGPIQLDLLSREGYAGGQRLGLHPREFDLLWRLAETPGVPVMREELLAEVWRLTYVPETNSVAVHVARLRRKLAVGGFDHWLRTSATGGYFLKVDASFSTAPAAMGESSLRSSARICAFMRGSQ